MDGKLTLVEIVSVLILGGFVLPALIFLGHQKMLVGQELQIEVIEQRMLIEALQSKIEEETQ